MRLFLRILQRMILKRNRIEGLLEELASPYTEATNTWAQENATNYNDRLLLLPNMIYNAV